MVNPRSKIIKTVFKQLLSCIFPLVIFISCTEQNKPKIEQINTSIIQFEQKNVSKKGIDINYFKANLTTEIGKQVLSVLQDRNDNYWFGTNTGVYCYDGKNLIVFTTKDGLFQNQVQDIQEDETGNIWFTTGGFGVSCFDGKGITTFTVKENIPLNTTSVEKWKILKGDLWFCAGGGAFHHCKDSFYYLPFPKPDFDSKYSASAPYDNSAYGVYCTLKDKSGNVWFGTQARGVCCYDGKSFIWFKEKGLSGPAVLAVFEDSNGDLWFGNNGEGLFCYDGKSLINVTSEKELSNPDFVKTGKSGPATMARVWAINEDNNGNIWVGTGDAGVWRYDRKNLTHYTKSNGLPNCGIETIYKDKKGNLWFGTDGDGVYKLNDSYFTKFAPGRPEF